MSLNAEQQRLIEDKNRSANWKRWGPYLSERQWGTVREDYSVDGEAWDYFPHEHARSRTYRWGEDGLLGFTDRECRLCFALALWNEKDPFLKERLYGLNGNEGNHGEDVKECYYYLDSSPTHSYCKALYKYPQEAFPYHELAKGNQKRSRLERELELEELGVFDEGKYFDVYVEYAKALDNDIFIKITIRNNAAKLAKCHVLPTLWFRNTWSWGCSHEGCTMKPRLSAGDKNQVLAWHPTLDRFLFEVQPQGSSQQVDWLFTENESNLEKLFGSKNQGPYVKDAFHQYLIEGKKTAVNPEKVGTKAAAHFALEIEAGDSVQLQCRLCSIQEKEKKNGGKSIFDSFDTVFEKRKTETDEFYEAFTPKKLTKDEKLICRQGYAGLLWSKQFYHFVVENWLEGDPDQLAPPPERLEGRNRDWNHFYARDVLSMPDKWEYPWFAAWDLAFHMIPFADIDPEFAKNQLLLLLREWYMHPNGQIPAYEWNFSDVNPPVHAWAVWRVYKIADAKGHRDVLFLEKAFQKLLMNFTWWVNRKDPNGKHIFAGGFLGLDNIGVFDRSKPLPTGGHLEQADGTAWMASYCITMLSIALELAEVKPAYEDIASKFFEHFVSIADAINSFGGSGLWDEEGGFYYDRLFIRDKSIPLRIRSMVGLLPLCAVTVLEQDVIDRLPGFKKRMTWFLENRKDLAKYVTYCESDGQERHGHRLLAIPSRERLAKSLVKMLDENEFLSAYGIRSLSKKHEKEPYIFRYNGEEHRVQYTPGESDSWMFGGNSNWRGPIWFPVNYLIIEALERYHYFYGDTFQVEYPSGSGQKANLKTVAEDIASRLVSIFCENNEGQRPFLGENLIKDEKKNWKELLLFHEYFHGDTGEGLGANHQTGWTALVVRLARLIHSKK